jgi:hypothetical protein
LNESVSFRVPGHYKVTAFSNQVGIPLRSNTLEIDIVAAEPEWATAKLRDAIAVLSGSGACPIVSPRTEDCRTKAARILRFLETREAALALVRRLPDAQGEARDHLRLGLFGSPYRKEILAAMESDMESADVPVDRIWMDTLIDLATVTETGPRPLQPKTFPALDRESELAWAQYQLDDSRYVAAFKPVIKRYYDRLAVAVERKRGQAREVTLQTVRSRPQQ